MAEFSSPMGAPHIPDDLTIPQFLFDYEHPIRMPRSPETPWIVDSATGRTYGRDELYERTWNLANGLSLRYSLGPDDSVGILSGNHVDFPISVWAAHRLGCSVFTLNPTFNAEEILPSIRDMKPSVLFVHPMALTAASAVGISPDRIVLLATSDKVGDHTLVTELVELGLANKATHRFNEFKLAPGEGKTKTALCFPSSGTTGVPKMAALPHAAIIANILQNAAWDMGLGEKPIPVGERRFRPGDVSLAALPFFHIFGLLVNLQYHLFSGMTVVVMPKFDFREFLNAIKTYKVNQLSLVPPIMVLFSKHPAVVAEDLTSIRVVYAGGAPVNLHFVQALAKLIPQAVIEQSYGMTEVSGIVAMPPLDRQVSTGSGGCLLPGNSARVVKTEVDGTTSTLSAPGEPGELYLRGPSIATHYVNNEKISTETFVDGWVRTGDEVYIDEKGEIFVVDRIKDFIKVRAFQVAPAELESRLAASPDVADCCVVPVPDEFSGQLPKAYVVLSAAALERVRVAGDPEGEKEKERIKTALIQDIAESKAKYKALAGGVEFIDAIPRNAAGKLLRRVLRAKAAEAVAQS
ncbi:acetyl-CoA synthetase-like protein [Mycena amicta]|nr:acetyl-CoA synthetase-like protein [Mycena amicta]